jgi:ABC-type polysaccharide/polyol phosphate transport system ATPase subunit
MYVHFAFAVGAHLEPEILVVEEVLAVGDAHPTHPKPMSSLRLCSCSVH